MSDHLVVELNNVKKSFKKFTLGPVNLTLEKGFSLGIAGANGSGKSTLFRLLVNILQADEGTIHFFGKFAAASESQHKQNIGFSGELVEAFSHLTIKELASYISYWYHIGIMKSTLISSADISLMKKKSLGNAQKEQRKRWNLFSVFAITQICYYLMSHRQEWISVHKKR